MFRSTDPPPPLAPLLVRPLAGEPLTADERCGLALGVLHLLRANAELRAAVAARDPSAAARAG